MNKINTYKEQREVSRKKYVETKDKNYLIDIVTLNQMIELAENESPTLKMLSKALVVLLVAIPVAIVTMWLMTK